MNRTLTPIAAAVAACIASTSAIPADLAQVIGRRYQPIHLESVAPSKVARSIVSEQDSSESAIGWGGPVSGQSPVSALPGTRRQDTPPPPRPFNPYKKVSLDVLNPFGPARLIKVNDFDPTRVSPSDGVPSATQPPAPSTPPDLELLFDEETAGVTRPTTPIPERRARIEPASAPQSPAAPPPPPKPGAIPQFGDLPLAVSPAMAPAPASTPPMVNVESRLSQMPPPPPDSAPQVAMSSPRNLVVRTGQNQIIEVSRFHLSRLVVPFSMPVIRTTSSADIEAKGQVLYISPQDDQPIAIHVTQDGNELQALVLTLLPKAIPPREIRISLSPEEAATVASAVTPNTEAQQWETRHPYVTTIMRLLTATAEGQVPPGYRFRRYTHEDPTVFCADPNLKISPLQIVEGHNLSLTVSSVKNVSNQDVTINELACHVPGVAAVSAYPTPFLRPGQVSELYVVNRKYPETASNRKRPSVIDPDYLRR